MKTITVGVIAAWLFGLGGCFFDPHGSAPVSDASPDGTADDGGGDGSSCEDGLTACGESCVDVETDEANCGRCGNACGLHEVCSAGACECPEPFLDCEGSGCIDPRSDREHCGGCGVSCGLGAICDDGECRCDDELTECDGRCVNTDTDPDHCGGCGNACDEGDVCDGEGHCSTGCRVGFTLCGEGGDAYCADLQGDALNCGDCGVICEAGAHAIPDCVDGECAFRCEEGYGDADGESGNGCECAVTGDEICDGLDNDCDGSIDETFDCVFGSTEACTNGGGCAGLRVCEAAGGECRFSACANPAWECSTPGATQPCARPGAPSCEGSQTCGEGCLLSECTSPAWECLPGESAGGCHPTGTSCPGERLCGDDCSFGSCQETCSGGTPDCCPGGCVDLADDDANCGICGRNCSFGERCCDGACRQCCDDGDCGDANPCTDDVCDPGTGTCTHSRSPDGSSCSSGLCCSGICIVGAECCTATQCDEGPMCTGWATSCSGFFGPVQCNAQLGCYWNTWTLPMPYCDGVAYDCDEINSHCSGCGCSFDNATGACGGTPADCSTFTPSSEPLCWECGCSWDDCSGTPAPCATYSCAAHDGCSWVTSGSCVGYHCYY